jgi:hypothetical protein
MFPATICPHVEICSLLSTILDLTGFHEVRLSRRHRGHPTLDRQKLDPTGLPARRSPAQPRAEGSRSTRLAEDSLR